MSLSLKPPTDALTARVSEVLDELLETADLVTPLDVLLALEMIEAEPVDLWRRGGLPYLERGITSGLARVARVLRIVKELCLERGLAPTKGRYSRRVGGRKQPLRFSKRGDDESEQAYSTHFVRAR
ncbi:MAG: hypothetical protein QM756_38685 [Polyangiaceae bacterium]